MIDQMIKLKRLCKLTLVICFTSLLLFSCKNASTGFAPGLPGTTNPSSPTAPQNPTNPLGSFMKNGTMVNSANGWSLQMDTTDAINSKTTANSWKIEVKYE